MANLQTLEGLSQAREDLYTKLEKGEITEGRALGMERLLRGQESLKAHVPIRLLSVIAKYRGPKAEQYSRPLIIALTKFTTGEDITALSE